MVQINTAMTREDRAWLESQAQRLGVARSEVVRRAIAFYREHAPVDPVPADPTPPTDTGDTETPKEPAMPPRKQARPSVTRPLATPKLSDRAECPVCRKQVGVHPETSLLADHIAHPSVRPRGQYQLCVGSGQEPAGPVVHAAETDWRRV